MYCIYCTCKYILYVYGFYGALVESITIIFFQFQFFIALNILQTNVHRQLDICHVQAHDKTNNCIACVFFMSVLFVLYIYLMRLTNHFRLSLHDLPAVKWCKKLRNISELRNPVGLVSVPGSGNTWLRYLLQQATHKIECIY